LDEPKYDSKRSADEPKHGCVVDKINEFREKEEGTGNARFRGRDECADPAETVNSATSGTSGSGWRRRSLKTVSLSFSEARIRHG
jgi:hypothetical protein